MKTIPPAPVTSPITSPVASLEHILRFTDLLHQFRTIERRVLVRNSERYENDVEHSYNLGMLGWYVNGLYDLHLDTDKICKYALAHDLVEVYAGDTFFYHQNDRMSEDKKEREEKAAERLKEEFPEFRELHEIIAEYEKREDPESRFIYALDKVEPMLSIYGDNGRTWKKDGVTLDMIKKGKSQKVAVDSTVVHIFNDLISRIKSEEDSLFS